MYKHLPTSECYTDVILWPQPLIFPQTSEVRMEVCVAEHHPSFYTDADNYDLKLFCNFIDMLTSCDQLKLENEAPWTLLNHPLGSLINSTWWKQHPQSTWCYWLKLGRFTVHTTEFILLDCPTQRSFCVKISRSTVLVNERATISPNICAQALPNQEFCEWQLNKAPAPSLWAMSTDSWNSRLAAPFSCV